MPVSARNGSLPFPVKDVDEQDVVLRSTEHSAVADLAAVLQLCAAGRLRCSETTRRPSAATQAAVAEILSADDFYEDEPIAAFAWPLLLQAGGLAELAGGKMKLTARGNKALSEPGAATIRLLWKRWVTGGLIDEFSRIDNIKGQKKARALTAVKPRRAVVADALAACCPPGEWVGTDVLFSRMRRDGYDPEICRGTSVWKLYLDDPKHGSLGYEGHHDWAVLQGRYTLAVLWEYAGTLGLLDLGYTEPEDARTADLPDYLDYYFEGALSRYDGLLAVRLNPLGAYATGRSDSLRPSPLPAGTETGLKVLDNLDVVATGALAAAQTLLLDAFAERASDRVWSLTTPRALAAIEAGRDLDELARFLTGHAGHELPRIVTGFLADVARRAAWLTDLGPVRLIECADPALASAIAAGPKTARLCRLVGDRHLAVPAEHDTAFRKAVLTLGYVLPPGGR